MIAVIRYLPEDIALAQAARTSRRINPDSYLYLDDGKFLIIWLPDPQENVPLVVSCGHSLPNADLPGEEVLLSLVEMVKTLVRADD